MPRKPPVSSPKSNATTINSLRTFATQKEHMASMEERLTRLVQWHEELGNNVLDLGERVASVEDIVNKYTAVANDNNQMLRTLLTCVAGVQDKGMERPGLVGDVQTLVTEQKKQGELISTNAERLSSLERTKATAVWAMGGLSTVACSLGLWAWSHTGEILATLNTFYDKPKTEAIRPESLDSKQVPTSK